MPNIIEGNLNAKGYRFGIVVSRFNDFICAKLVDGAVDALIRHGASADDITIIKVPGAFEIPSAARQLCMSGRFDSIICLGAVIRGATPHFDYIASEVSKGVAALSLKFDIPVTFGVLTTDTLEQAIERAGSKSGNKGFESAVSAVEMTNLFYNIKS